MRCAILGVYCRHHYRHDMLGWSCRDSIWEGLWEEGWWREGNWKWGEDGSSGQI